jgi:hypothetical protein
MLPGELNWMVTCAIAIVLGISLVFLMWMLSKFFPPLEPKEPVQPIAEVKGEGVVA